MNETMKLCELSDGDVLHRYKQSLVVCFNGKRKVLSTGPNNGGLRYDLQAVFNYDGNPGSGMQASMRADTYEEHMHLVAKEDLGLDPEKCTGLCTAASMYNAAIERNDYDDFSVTAIVTGGIYHNAGRIGDPAFWHEQAGIFHKVPLGTINILLLIDADLTDGAIARALVSCTEAKTAAIQELLAPSRYSRGLATGSGTDGTIVFCNMESDTHLTDAGKHSKLGELIGRTVKQAVKQALKNQTYLCPKFQHDILNRMDRFGVTEDSLWERYKNQGGTIRRAEFTDRLDRCRKENRIVTYSSLYAHLLDQLDWGLITSGEAEDAGAALLKQMGFPDKAETGHEQQITEEQKSEQEMTELESEPVTEAEEEEEEMLTAASLETFDREEESWQEPEREEREAGIERMTEWYLDGLIGYLAEAKNR